MIATFSLRKMCGLSLLVLALCATVHAPDARAQEGQGNVILTMGGDCAAGGRGVDFQVRGCAPEGTRVYLVADNVPGPFVHPLGTFCVAFSDNAVIRKGRIGADGMVSFWIDEPFAGFAPGETVFWQAAYFDDSAPNGLAITNCVCVPVCEPDTTYACRTAIGGIEGILIVGPESDFPLSGVLSVSNDSDTLSTVLFSFDLPGPGGEFDSDNGVLTIQRITTLDPCVDQNGATRLAIQFKLSGGPLPEHTLPASTTIAAEIDGETTAVTLDTSCENPIGVGLRTRPLILTCIEDCPNLDFETGDDFLTALPNGRALDSAPEFGVIANISSISALGTAIFDSNTGGANDPGRDGDLLVDLGNIVIIQEDPTQTVDGIFDFPDDEGGGGMFVFEFVRPVMALRIDLVDIDVSNQGVALVLTDGSGRKRTFDVPSAWTTDIERDGGPGFGTLDLTTLDDQPGENSTATATEDTGFDARDVVKLEADFGGSGGLDNLQVCPTIR